jgi:hypothetical protein
MKPTKLTATFHGHELHLFFIKSLWYLVIHHLTDIYSAHSFSFLFQCDYNLF